MADFVVNANGPRIENVKTFQPGERSKFYESHGFSEDDGKMIFSGNLSQNQEITGFDIYELDLRTGEVTNLTSTPNDWAEDAHLSPDGKKIAWMSSTGYDLYFRSVEWGQWQRYLKTELWIMNADASDKQRLTYFNELGHPEYMGTRTIVSDLAWGPDGKEIAALIVYEGPGGKLKSKIVIVELR